MVDWFEVIRKISWSMAGARWRCSIRPLSNAASSSTGWRIYFGSADKLNCEHLRKLKRLVKRTKHALTLRSLCWGSADGRYTHDLLPMPYTFAAARVTAQ